MAKKKQPKLHPNPTLDKSKLPSRHVRKGRSARRTARTLRHGPDRGADRPAVRRRRDLLERGRALQHRAERQAQAVKKGVAAAGGTPREFTTITVTDGIAMGHQGMKSSLGRREVIADSVELTMRGHCYDALVGIAGCDKSLPGMMMAMLRLNVPSSSSMAARSCPASSKGKDVTVVDVFEARRPCTPPAR